MDEEKGGCLGKRVERGARGFLYGSCRSEAAFGRCIFTQLDSSSLASPSNSAAENWSLVDHSSSRRMTTRYLRHLSTVLPRQRITTDQKYCDTKTSAEIIGRGRYDVNVGNNIILKF